MAHLTDQELALNGLTPLMIVLFRNEPNCLDTVKDLLLQSSTLDTINHQTQLKA